MYRTRVWDMINLLASPITKGLSIVALVLASTTAFTTHLYLSTRDDLASLQSQHTQLKQVVQEIEDSKEKLLLSSAQDDKLITEKEIKIATISESLQQDKKALVAIPKKTKCISEGVTIEKTKYVDIDQPFDADFIRVFKQSNNNKRSPNTSSH